MNVVVRGLMAAGMWVYAAIHIQQAFRPPEGAPAWLAFGFGVTAVLAVVIGGMLILTSVHRETRWEVSAALLALASAVALLASYTVGFFGVAETDLRAETAVVLVAELLVIVAFLIGRFTSSETDEDDHDHNVFRTEHEPRSKTAERGNR